MRSFLTTIAGVPILLLTQEGRSATNNPPTPAQAPIIQSWGTQAGLPQNSVNAVAQTRDGYLWLGTSDGLARFDGMRFKIWGLENGLPSVNITALLEDREGVLWIGTSGSGLCCLKQGRIEVMTASGTQPGSDTINCLEEDATGRLWVGTAGGLRFCRDGKLIEDAAFGNLVRGPIRCLLHSGDGKTMWISSDAIGLFKYENGQVEPCVGPAGHEELHGEALLEDRQGRFWVGIGNGTVLCREKNQWRIFNESDGLPFAFVTCFGEDADGTVWAGSLDAGLYRFDGAHFNLISQKDGLSAEDIRCLLCDREGNLWIGTRTGGLDRLSRRRMVVIANAQGLTNDFTRSVAQTADGTLWVGTVGGSLYRGGPSGFTAFRPPQEDRVYYYATVYPVITAPDDSLWWGAYRGLLHWKNGRLADCFTNEPWVQNAQVTALLNGRQGGIWIGTSAGHLLHYRNGQFTEFPSTFTPAAITSLALQPDGALWVGTAASGLQLIRENIPDFLTLTNGLSCRCLWTARASPARCTPVPFFRPTPQILRFGAFMARIPTSFSWTFPATMRFPRCGRWNCSSVKFLRASSSLSALSINLRSSSAPCAPAPASSWNAPPRLPICSKPLSAILPRKRKRGTSLRAERCLQSSMQRAVLERQPSRSTSGSLCRPRTAALRWWISLIWDTAACT